MIVGLIDAPTVKRFHFGGLDDEREDDEDDEDNEELSEVGPNKMIYARFLHSISQTGKNLKQRSWLKSLQRAKSTR